MYATATGRSNPIEEAEFENLVINTPFFPCEEKIVCRWNRCSKIYDTYLQYDDHFKKEHKPKLASRNNKFYCQWIDKNGALCDKTYSTEKYLIRHINIHTGKYKCDYPGCRKSFALKSHLTYHERTHTGEKPFSCDHPGCNKSFAQKSNLTTHQRKHTAEKPFICDHPDCGKSFAKISNLITHQRKHTGEKPFMCNHPNCGKSFNSKSNLTKHKRTHTGEKPFICDHPGCGKSFAQKGNLTRHIRIHIEESLLQSDYPDCGISFTRKNHQTTHPKIHTSENLTNNTQFLPSKEKIVCRWNHCSKKYATYPEYQNHFKEEHSEVLKGKDGRFHCQWIIKNGILCTKSYTEKKVLIYKHLITHTGEKPFKCDHPGCTWAFAQRGSLTNHQRKHTGEKPYKCDHPGCSKTFTQSGNLATHKKNHLPKAMCNICRKAFRDLNAHKKRRHNK